MHYPFQGKVQRATQRDVLQASEVPSSAPESPAAAWLSAWRQAGETRLEAFWRPLPRGLGKVKQNNSGGRARPLMRQGGGIKLATIQVVSSDSRLMAGFSGAALSVHTRSLARLLAQANRKRLRLRALAVCFRNCRRGSWRVETSYCQVRSASPGSQCDSCSTVLEEV